jgi:regulator of sigma E protease
MFKDETDFLDKIGLSLWVRGIGIAEVLANSPAQRAGLKAQDKILLVDGKELDNAQQFVVYVQQHNAKSMDLQIARGDAEQLNISVTPEAKQVDGKTVGGIGAAVGQYMTKAMHTKLIFTQHYAPLEALWRGVLKTKQMSLVTLKLMGRMVTGEVSIKNISGPVTIAQFAGETASIGVIAFLGFLAIVSVSLGVLNLLPIPMLDGGHLLYYLIELVKGSPVTEQFEAVGLKIGMAFIGGLMMLALYNDLMRLMN